MPPIVRYSKEKIVDVALKIVEEKGIDSVSARSVAKELGCSICPVFSCFESMDLLKKELLNEMYRVYLLCVEENMKKNNKPFKGTGIGYIEFAKKHKNYFKALFMSNIDDKLFNLLGIDENNKKIERAISEEQEISKDEARRIHGYCWIFVHGIAVMQATGYCTFSEEEIDEMLSEQYLSLIEKMKKESTYENN